MYFLCPWCTLWKLYPCCWSSLVSFRSYVLCIRLPLLSFYLCSSLFTYSVFLLFLPLTFSLISLFFPLSVSLFHTDSLAVTQTSVLLMTCSVFLTCAVLATVLLLLHTIQTFLSPSLTHTLTHSVGLIPTGNGGPVPPLLSPCWLLAVISHSRADTPSIMEAKLPSSLWPITHITTSDFAPSLRLWD